MTTIRDYIPFLLQLVTIVGCHSYILGPPAKRGAATTALDLRLPPEIFAGRLPERPGVTQCHPQGLAIAGDRLVMSCCMFTSRTKRATSSRSFLLSAPIAAIEQDAAEVPWSIVDITTPAPSLDAQLGHPSGLVYDGQGVWVANAVYAPHTQTQIRRYDPVTLIPNTNIEIVVDDHIGTLALSGLQGEVLVGFNWNSERAYRWRAEKLQGKPTRLSGATYQDCTAINGNVLCGYVQFGSAHIDVLDRDLRVSTTRGLPNSPYTRHGLTREGLTSSTDGRYLYFLPDDLPGAYLIRLPLGPNLSSVPDLFSSKSRGWRPLASHRSS